jgi:hypothetical protein
MSREGLLMIAGIFAATAVTSEAVAQAPVTVEQLLQEGWEIAGYIAAWENRSLILFRHKDYKYLVQCSVLVDVMRSPRVVTYCYDIR